jgi:hypothetical protein
LNYPLAREASESLAFLSISQQGQASRGHCLRITWRHHNSGIAHGLCDTANIR